MPTEPPVSPAPPVPPPVPAGPTDPGARITALDALRGFALAGIVFINVPQTFGIDVHTGPAWITAGVYQRFFVIFSLLFGLGFGIFLERAGTRTHQPRVVLLRRMAVLFPLGLLHLTLQPGEVLSLYAVCGIVFLLPATFLPRPLVAPVGVALYIVGLEALGAAGSVPGLFVLGLAAARYDLHRRLPARPVALAAVVVAAGLAALGLHRLAVGADVALAAFALPATVSVAYIAAFLLLLLTPLRGALEAVFVPLGRTALTGYLLATVVFVTVGRIVGLADPERVADPWPLIVAIGVGTGLVQLVASRWWLARYRFGPLEWAWRCLTWGERVPLARVDAAADGSRATS